MSEAEVMSCRELHEQVVESLDECWYQGELCVAFYRVHCKKTVCL